MATTKPKRKQSALAENIKTLVYAGLIAVGVRTVAVEPFNIPSGSMIPTLLVGDYLFVSKYSYGYSRFSLPFSPPLFAGRILERPPQRGDVAVFKNPRDNATDYIKRIVGLPGDKVQMRHGQLYINGNPAPRAPLGTFEAKDAGIRMALTRYEETLPGPDGKPGNKHQILKATDGVEQARRPGFDPNREFDPNNTPEYVVPAGHVFAMGDNRDNSADSRFMNSVGFVPIENLVGRAEFLFFSIDAEHPWWQFWAWPMDIRWSRLLMPVR
jgi:signal peptidase I